MAGTSTETLGVVPDLARMLPSRAALAVAAFAVLAGGIALGLLSDPATGRADRQPRARVAVAVSPPPPATTAAAAATVPEAPVATAEPEPEPDVESSGSPASTETESDTQAQATPDTDTDAGAGSDDDTNTATTPEPLAPVGHVWLIVLADQRFDTLFDPAAAPYLAGELRPKGLLLSHLYAVGHESLPNGIALLSGRLTTDVTRGNCPVYGGECLQAPDVPTLAGQLTGAGKTWRAYVESIGSPCRHPDPDAPDPWQGMRAGDPYATWRDPFVYFHEIIDSPDCAGSVVGLDSLASDLADKDATPAFSYLVPDLCHDGRADVCAPGAPSGTGAADAWLRTVLPQILDSAAYKDDGLVIVTSDQAAGDDAACCTLPRPGGGRVGALLLSPLVEPGGEITRPMSHLSILRLLEDLFGLEPLADAGSDELPRVGASAFTSSQPVHAGTTGT